MQTGIKQQYDILESDLPKKYYIVFATLDATE